MAFKDIDTIAEMFAELSGSVTCDALASRAAYKAQWMRDARAFGQVKDTPRTPEQGRARRKREAATRRKAWRLYLERRRAKAKERLAARLEASRAKAS